MAVQHALGALLVLLALLLLWALRKQFGQRTTTLPAERVFLVVLAAMPFFGFLLARFVTHSIEVRYVLPAIVGIAVLTAMAVAPLMKSRRIYVFGIALLLLAIVAAGVVRIREQAAQRRVLIASLAITPQLHRLLLAAPGTRLYVQNLGFFDEITPYLPIEIRSRMVLLYSRDEELHWLNHDTGALTATHMQHFTNVPTARYEDLRQQPGTQLVLLHTDGWEWLGRALVQDGAHTLALQPALGGGIVAVQFAPASQKAP